MVAFSRQTVGVSSHLLSEAMLAEVAAACRRIDAEATFGTLEQLELCGADILIGGLSAGRRSVPDEYLSFIARRAVDTSLLLLCEEALVRPFVSLSQGRVTLVSTNPEADMIYHRLRVLLAERATAHGASAERAAPTWWTADSRSSGVVRSARGDDHGSLTLAFELDVGDESVEPVSLRRTPDPALCLKQAHSNTLGAGTGVLHFASAEQEWLVCWPNMPGTLWLLSPLRLPPVSDLSVSHGGRGSTRLPAASGDIAVALSASTRDEASLAGMRGLAAKAALGGPSVFDAVRASLRNDAWASVVEVR